MPMDLALPGHAPLKIEVMEGATENQRVEYAYFVFYARTFKVMRQRGVIKCVPKLLALLRQARINLFAPNRTDGQAMIAAWEDGSAMA